MTKIWLKIISILEIVGGVFGIIFLLWWYIFAPFNFYSLFVAPIPITVFSLSIVAGVGLWKDSSFGRITSIIIQTIQLPKIFSQLIIFMFSFGFDLWIQLFEIDGEFLNFGMEFRFLAFNQFFLNVRDAPTGIGISITAAIFLVMLIKHKPQTLKEILPPLPPTFEQSNDQ